MLPKKFNRKIIKKIFTKKKLYNYKKNLQNNFFMEKKFFMETVKNVKKNFLS